MDPHQEARDKFRTELIAAIDGAERSGQYSDVDLAALISGLRSHGDALSKEPRTDLRALDHLAIANATAADGTQISAFAQAFVGISETLPWYQRQEINLPDFMAGHANAYVFGPGGLEDNAHVHVGVSLLAPGITYPDHHHPPQELYIILSEGEWRQNDGPWHSPGIGGYVYNPANIIHAMRSGDTPLLAVWCLWGMDS